MRALARARDERGAVAVLVSLVVAFVLLGVAALTVDIGNTWARRGQLQTQADQAALFAASYLPANDDAGRTRVARAAAWYLMCHPVAGQHEYDAGVPTSCPASPDSADQGLTAFAGRLLAAGEVSFPTISGSTGSYVKVVTPPARVQFGFGSAEGASASVQTRQAVARVASPGTVEPISLSLNCLLSAAGNLPAGLGDSLSGVLPLNYIAPGPISVDHVTTKWPSSAAMPTSNTISLLTMAPATATQGVNPGPVTVTGLGWGLAGLSQVKLFFAQGDQSAAAVSSLPSAPVTGTQLVAGLGVVSIPSQVYSRAGVWKVRVGVQTLTGWSFSKQDYEFTVELPTVTQDLLGCARLTKNPRDLQQGTGGNLQYNLLAGLDHPLAANPAVTTLSLPQPLSTTSLLSVLGDVNGLFQCINTTGGRDVYDNGGQHPTANCVMPEQGANTYKEFTDGMLGAPTTVPADPLTGTPSYTTAGRLVCTDTRPCQRSFTLPGFPGEQINDDHFEDFVLPDRQDLLTSATFFDLDTYLLDDTPVVTPQSALSPEIYQSARFMWAPVISAPTAPNSAGYYPILTFRPIFVTQDAPSGIEAVDMVLDIVDSWVKTLLGISPGDDHGLLMDDAGTTLRALRFMTIEPAALPAVPGDYDGPISDYLGTGPKVIRLVR